MLVVEFIIINHHWLTYIGNNPPQQKLLELLLFRFPWKSVYFLYSYCVGSNQYSNRGASSFLGGSSKSIDCFLCDALKYVQQSQTSRLAIIIAYLRDMYAFAFSPRYFPRGFLNRFGRYYRSFSYLGE